MCADKNRMLNSPSVCSMSFFSDDGVFKGAGAQKLRVLIERRLVRRVAVVRAGVLCLVVLNHGETATAARLDSLAALPSHLNHHGSCPPGSGIGSHDHTRLRNSASVGTSIET